MARVSKSASVDVAAAAPEKIKPIDQPKLVTAVLVADVIVVLIAALIAGMTSVMPEASVLFLGLVLSGLVVLFAQKTYAYTVTALGQPVRQIARMVLAIVGSAVALVAAAWLFQLEAYAPRGFVLGWFGLSLAGIGLVRVPVSAMVRRWTVEGRLARRAVVAGGGRQADELIAMLRRSSNGNIKVCGVFDDRAKDRAADPADRYRVLGTFEDLEGFCRKEDIDLIIVTLPSSAEERILMLMKKLWTLPIDVRIAAHQSKLRLRPRAYTYIGDVPFLAVFDKPLSDWGWAIKDIEDRVIAVLALIMLSPVMLAVAIAVKWTSKGPVLFRQKRHGFNNQLIDVYKFRSMYTDMCDADARKQVTKDDPRVTPVGRFIRKTSLDELPQLFNVLKGELSLVGPRPHATACKAGERFYNDVVDGYYARHRMKPGITGLAQIHGWRGETDTEEKLMRRVEYDIQYIDNWSIWMDLYILAMTPVSLLNTKNAY